MNQSYFQEAFPHRFELTDVLGQDEGQKRLKEALDMIRFRKCDEETEQYFVLYPGTYQFLLWKIHLQFISTLKGSQFRCIMLLF